MYIKVDKNPRTLMNLSKQNKKISILVFSVRTFYLDILAIRYLEKVEFRYWFILITMSFLAVTVGRTGILEPYLLGYLSKLNTLKKYLSFTSLSFCATFFITYSIFNVSLEMSLQFSLCLSNYLVMDLLRYMAIKLDKSFILKTEVSLFIITISSSQFLLVFGDFNLMKIVLIQFVFCPYFYFLMIPKLQILNYSQDQKQKLSPVTARGMFATSIMSAFLGLLNLILLQNFLSANFLVFYKSVDSIVGIVRSIQRISWSIVIVEPRKKIQKIQRRKLITLLLLVPLGLPILSDLYEVDSRHEFLLCSSISILSQMALIFSRYIIVDRLLERRILPFITTSLGGFILTIPYLILFRDGSDITIYFILNSVGIFLSLLFTGRQNS